MANFCVSIDLATSCCSRNYLENVCKVRARMFRGRRYEFVWSPVSSVVYLCCNSIRIGEVYRGTLGIYSPFSSLGLTKTSLSSLMALFNLYPL